MIIKKCSVSGKEFTITEKDLNFYRKMELISATDYEKLKSREISDCIGLPSLCPEERARRRTSWRNERKLYKRKCDATKKDIISIYKEESPFPVYDQKYWWSDNWDPLKYGKDFDFSRPFFEQFEELMNKVPRLSIINSQSQNSIYTNFSSRNKNCYFTFGMFFDEEVHYSHYGSHCRDCLDCLRISHCELCYECIDCEKCYELLFSQDCQNCNTSSFLKNCIGCNNCFGCINLRNKEYYFMNKKLSKEEYEKKITELGMNDNNNLKGMRNNFLKYCQKFPHRFMIGTKNNNVVGNFIYNCKNCDNCFSAGDCEDCKYGYQIDAVNSSYDMNCMGYDKSELCYECTGGTDLFETITTECVWMSANISYCGQCFNNCSNLFGCIGLKHAEYCILNKRYTKEDYFKIREKIVEHMKKTSEWGEFFPAEISPFSYNETVAQEYFPLTKDEILAKNLKYCEEKQEFKYDGPKYEIPAKIKDINDDILDKILTCDVTKKYYKIQRSELNFYRKMNLPIPTLCPNERHKQRMVLRNPRTLFERNCSECQEKILTSFAPNRPEKVCCEKCYIQQVN